VADLRILFVSETRHKEGQEISLNGWQTFATGKGGKYVHSTKTVNFGVAFYVKDDLASISHCSLVKDLSTSRHSAWLRVCQPESGLDLHVGGYYVPNDFSDSQKDIRYQLWQELERGWLKSVAVQIQPQLLQSREARLFQFKWLADPETQLFQLGKFGNHQDASRIHFMVFIGYAGQSL